MHEEGKLLLQHAGGSDLHDVHGLGDGELGGHRTEDMDVVFVRVYLNDHQFRVLTLETLHEDTEVTANTALEELSAEFGREYDVIAGVVDRMGLALIDGHLCILAEDSGTYPSAGCRPQF